MRAQKRNLMNLSDLHFLLWPSAQTFRVSLERGRVSPAQQCLNVSRDINGVLYFQGQGSVSCFGFCHGAREAHLRAQRRKKLKKTGPIGKNFQCKFFPRDRTVRWQVSGHQRCPGMPSCAQTMPRAGSGRAHIPGQIPGLWGQRCREERKFNTTKDLRNRHTTRSCTLRVASSSSVCVMCFD